MIPVRFWVPLQKLIHGVTVASQVLSLSGWGSNPYESAKQNGGYMSQFYGTVQGNRGQTSRGGSKNSGIETSTASWSGAIRCYAYYDKETDTDMVRVEKTTWRGSGDSKILYEGPIGQE